MSKVRVKNDLPKFVQTTEGKMVRAATQMLSIGASEASVLTPIDTSTLINSQFKSVTKEGDRIVGRVGYTADYARYVHDPEVKQNFRRESAEKEFLKKGFERAQENITGVLTGAIKT